MRKRSMWEDVWHQMQVLREKRFARDGVATIREKMEPARLNAQLRALMASLLALASEGWSDGAELYLIVSWQAYLEDEWARSLTPPCPLVGFANPIVLAKCWSIAEREICGR